MSQFLIEMKKGISWEKEQGYGSGSGRIGNFWPDLNLIQKRNNSFGSEFESGSEINLSKED
jgi:hypothetical protein